MSVQHSGQSSFPVNAEFEVKTDCGRTVHVDKVTYPNQQEPKKPVTCTQCLKVAA